MDQKAIQDLKARCTMAAAQGFHIGRASYYVAELQKMVGTPDILGVASDTPEYLLVLIEMAEKGEKAPKAAAPQPKVEPPKVEPPVEVEAKIEAAAEIEVEEATTEAEDATGKKTGGKKKGK